MTNPTPASWHSHIYFDAASHSRAEALVADIKEAFGETAAITYGRWHHRPVGPRPDFSIQLEYMHDLFAGVLPANNGDLQHVRRAGRREGGFSVWSFANDDLVTVEAISDPAAYVLGKACLERGRAPHPAQLADAGFDLKAFVADKSVA